MPGLLPTPLLTSGGGVTAPTFTNLTSNGASSATSFTTASVTPTGNRLILVSVHAYISTGSVAPSAPTVTGNGITYTQIGTGQDVDTAGADRAKLFIFRGMAASPTAGAITISFGATTMTRCLWVVDQSDVNVDTTGTNGSGAIVSPPVGATVASGTTASVNYSPAMTSGNSGYAAVAHQTNEQVTPRSGWTELADTFPVTLGNLETQYIAGTDTAASGTWTTSARGAVIALEIQPPVTGPTVTAFQTSDWTGTTTPKTITISGAVTGDKIVVLCGGDNASSGNVSAAAVTTTGGSTSSWTKPEEGLAATNQAWISSSVADVTADGTVTVSLARTQSTGQPWGGWAALVNNHNGIGVHARSAPSATETVTLTGVTQDSAVLLLGIDWDDLANVAFSPGGATDVQRTFGTNVAWYAGYWRGQASGTRGYGIATSSTTNLHIIAIEALAATTGGVSADASLSGTATLTGAATNAKPVDAALSGTASATATATGSKSVDAALSGTGTLTASATPTRNADAALVGTGTLASTATADKPLSATAAAIGTLTAAAGNTKPVDATLTAAGTLTATATSNKSAAASLSASGTLTASATVTNASGIDASLAGTGTLTSTATSVKPVAAALTATGSLTATAAADRSVSGALAGTGVLTGAATATKPAAANLAATGTLTASAAVTTSGVSIDAARSGTGTLTATALLARPVAAALSGTVTATAQMVVTKSISGVLVGVGSLSASADSAGQVTIRPNTGTTTRPGSGRTIRPNTGTTERP